MAHRLEAGTRTQIQLLHAEPSSVLAPSSVGAPSSILAPSSKARSP